MKTSAAIPNFKCPARLIRPNRRLIRGTCDDDALCKRFPERLFAFNDNLRLLIIPS